MTIGGTRIAPSVCPLGYSSLNGMNAASDLGPEWTLTDEGAAACADFAGWIGRDDFDPTPSPGPSGHLPASSAQPSQVVVLHGVGKSVVQRQQTCQRRYNQLGRPETDGLCRS